MNKILCRLIICFYPLFFFSCYDEENTFGNGLVDTVFRNVSVDTSTVVVTSVLIDSLETSGKGVALIGRYTHSLWGTVSTCTYLPYKRTSYSTDIDETVVLDSLVLSLGYNGYSVGDTLSEHQFSVHRLMEKVVLNDNDYLYNHSSFRYDPVPLAVCRFRPKPGSSERLEIRLPDALGQDMLNRFHTRDESVSDDGFEDYFKGLVISPDLSVGSSLLSFEVSDTLSALILHYHVLDEQENEQMLTFSPNTATQFNHIDHDRKGTSMEPYPAKNIEISSVGLGDRGILFGGLGWYTRLEFPFINNLLQQGSQVEIQKALLKIYPESGTYSDLNTLPDSIYLYIADENNVVTNAVTDYLGTQVQGGVWVKDDTFNEKTYLYFDITDFMQQELGAFGMYKHNLQLVLNEDSYTQTFKNLTFSSQQGRSPIVLQLIYKIYESY